MALSSFQSMIAARPIQKLGDFTSGLDVSSQGKVEISSCCMPCKIPSPLARPSLITPLLRNSHTSLFGVNLFPTKAKGLESLSSHNLTLEISYSQQYIHVFYICIYIHNPDYDLGDCLHRVYRVPFLPILNGDELSHVLMTVCSGVLPYPTLSDLPLIKLWSSDRRVTLNQGNSLPGNHRTLSQCHTQGSLFCESIP